MDIVETLCLNELQFPESAFGRKNLRGGARLVTRFIAEPKGHISSLLSYTFLHFLTTLESRHVLPSMASSDRSGAPCTPLSLSACLWWVSVGTCLAPCDVGTWRQGPSLPGAAFGSSARWQAPCHFARKLDFRGPRSQHSEALPPGNGAGARGSPAPSAGGFAGLHSRRAMARGAAELPAALSFVRPVQRPCEADDQREEGWNHRELGLSWEAIHSNSKTGVKFIIISC